MPNTIPAATTGLPDDTSQGCTNCIPFDQQSGLSNFGDTPHLPDGMASKAPAPYGTALVGSPCGTAYPAAQNWGKENQQLAPRPQGVSTWDTFNGLTAGAMPPRGAATIHKSAIGATLTQQLRQGVAEQADVALGHVEVEASVVAGNTGIEGVLKSEDTPSPSRRGFLRGLTLAPAAAGLAAVPTLAIAGPAVDPIFAAIEHHGAARAAFNKACGLTDEVVARQEGRAITAADEERYRVTGIAEASAFEQFAGTTPTTVHGIKAMLEYFNRYYDEFDDIADTMIAALVASPAITGGVHG